MAVLDATYTVALCDHPGLTQAERTAAEVRFAVALEHQFGGPDDIATTLHTIDALERVEPEDVSAHDLVALQHWVRALGIARLVGYRGLAPRDGSRFEVRLG